MDKIRLWEIIIGIIATIATISFFKEHNNKLSKQDFRAYEKEFRAEVDTLNIKVDRANYQLDTVRLELDSLKRNADNLIKKNDLIYYDMDSLKKGQIIIYRAINKQKSDRNLFEKIKLLLK